MIQMLFHLEPVVAAKKVCELCGRTYWNRWAHVEECSGPKQ